MLLDALLTSEEGRRFGDRFEAYYSAKVDQKWAEFSVLTNFHAGKR